MVMSHPQEVIEISDDEDNDAPQIKESEWKKRLFASLNAIQAERKFVAFKSYQEFVNPGLKIRGHQVIPLPLTDHYAEIIKGLCDAAKGTNGTTQNIWELDRSQFDLINPAWPSCLDRIAQEITKELGFENTFLCLENLTLQKPGPMARQSEGLEPNCAIGHISVCLPSEHRGGDIHVSLGQRGTSISTIASSFLDLSAIGWISDANYQATELVSGYRLTISYALHQSNLMQRPVPSPYVGSGRVEEVLRMWRFRYSSIKKILYKLDDKNGTGVLSLQEAKDRDRAVCEALSAACPEAGLHMLFAEITHEITDDCGSKRVESSIDGLYTSEGHFLTENKELDAENEVLGFDVDRQWDLDPDSDDDEGESNEYLIEEHEMTRRWHDHAVLLVPKEGLLDLVRLGDQKSSWPSARNTRNQETYHSGIALVVAMAVEDLEKNPGGTIKAAESIIDKLCRSEDVMEVRCINPIVNWSLRSGYMPLYRSALRKASIHVVHVLTEYLAKKYQGSEDSIDWKECNGELYFSPDRLEPKEVAWSAQVPRHDLICGPFVQLVNECRLIGAVEEASRILEETFSNLIKAKAKWILVRDPFGVIFCLIAPFVPMFSEGQLPKIPAVLEVLELLVRKIIRFDLPKQSYAIGGWVFRERGCGFCEDCAKLNRFLTSPQETIWEFSASRDRRLHLEHAIGIDMSLHVTTVSELTDSTLGTLGTLRVTKTAAQAQPNLQSWNFNFKGLKKVLQPMEGEFMKRALGKQRYREIILLEGVTPYLQPPSLAGVRRPATQGGLPADKRLCAPEMP
ncbi:hypothetical protein IL306_004346 [Fusarium sp. DS 682]|nr:hypothetical protein IL306_004346 [Fusarium sp. DS 682]